MGRTGCGKTTLLEILCGLRRPGSGSIFIGGREVTHLPPGKRGVGYVPQDGALFPTLTVGRQLGFAPRLRGRPEDEISVLVDQLAGQLGITHLLDRRPQHLSGGERQRVALGRALAAGPVVLLLDEPLSALDEAMREDTATLLHTLQRKHKLTALHVTHNPKEAGRLADHIFRFEDGKILEDRR